MRDTFSLEDRVVVLTGGAGLFGRGLVSAIAAAGARLVIASRDVARLGAVASMEEVAQNLYAALRALDQADVSVILVRDLGPEGLGSAIRDRLTRAAAGRVIVVTGGV